MTTNIAGRRLTGPQLAALDAVLDYLRQYAGDSTFGPHTSPAGDGRWVPLLEIFPERTNQGSARRRTARHLAELGVLRACEVNYRDGCVRAEPYLIM